jgi:hypothetical protein
VAKGEEGVMNPRTLSRISTAAVLGISTYAEVGAGAAIGLPQWHPFGADLPPVGLPLLLPAAIDCYVVSALERDRDVPAALTILAAAIVGGAVYHAHEANPNDWIGPCLIAAGAGLLLVMVMWRNHVVAREVATDAELLADAQAERAKAEQARVAAEAEAAAARAAAEAATTAAEHARSAASAAEDEARDLAERLAARDAQIADLSRRIDQAATADGRGEKTARRPKTPPADTTSRRRAVDHKSEVLDLIRGVLREHPDAGRDRILPVIRQGFTCSTDDLRDLIAEARRPHSVVAGASR